MVVPTLCGRIRAVPTLCGMVCAGRTLCGTGRNGKFHFNKYKDFNDTGIRTLSLGFSDGMENRDNPRDFCLIVRDFTITVYVALCCCYTSSWLGPHTTQPQETRNTHSRHAEDTSQHSDNIIYPFVYGSVLEVLSRFCCRWEQVFEGCMHVQFVWNSINIA